MVVTLQRASRMERRPRDVHRTRRRPRDVHRTRRRPRDVHRRRALDDRLADRDRVLAPINGHDPFPRPGTLLHPAAVLLGRAPGDAPVLARLVRAVKELVLRPERLALSGPRMRRLVCRQRRAHVTRGGRRTRHGRACARDGEGCCSREDQAPQGQLADIHRGYFASRDLFLGVIDGRRERPPSCSGLCGPKDLLAALGDYAAACLGTWWLNDERLLADPACLPIGCFWPSDCEFNRTAAFLIAATTAAAGEAPLPHELLSDEFFA
jgi:hypothetical protein